MAQQLLHDLQLCTRRSKQRRIGVTKGMPAAFCEDRAALTCRSQPSWHTREPRARPPFPSASLPRFSHLVHPTKQLARHNVRCLDPLVDDILYPSQHRNCAGMACLSLPNRQWPSVLHAVECVRNLAQLPHVAVDHRQVGRPAVLDHVLRSSARRREAATVSATVQR